MIFSDKQLIKKSLESCYRIPRKSYISKQLNKDTEKKIYMTQKH